MKLIVAENAGFCFGVKNAVKMTEELIKRNKAAFTLGPLIHNPQEVKRLQKNNILEIGLKDINNNDTLIIRAHGVAKPIIDKAISRGVEVVDATCPIVKKVQKLAYEISKKGYLVIIIGDYNHPEVLGIKNSCDGDVKIIGSAKEAINFYTNRPVGIVVQTTQTQENVENIIRILSSKFEIKEFHNTRCNATRKRQETARTVAKKVDIMIVVGGRNSSNTKKLTQVCQSEGAKVYHIETAQELKKDYFKLSNVVGITAGASTPDWILKEVITKMEEINKDLKNAETNEIPYEDTFTDIKENTTLKGKVVRVDEDEVIVDIGYKSDGIIPLRELSNIAIKSPEDVVKEGDEIDVYVIKLEDKDGNVLLSKKRADAQIAWNKIEEAFDKGESIEGKVTNVVKGGVLADIGGIKGFIPASHLDIRYVPDLSVYVDKQLELTILELERSKNRIVLSHKQILEKELEILKNKTWESLEEGQLIKGIVRRLTDFGAFVDIGGVDGLIHISDLAWHKVNHPSEIVSVDEEVEVKVLKLERERERISLGLKQTQPNPWDTVAERYETGSIIEGKVMKLVSFGAFVEVEPGVEGLVHISQISKKHIPTPGDVLSVGDIVKVKIMDINAEERKMSLSIREATEEVKEHKNSYEQPKENGITIGEMVGEELEKKLNIKK